MKRLVLGLGVSADDDDAKSDDFSPVCCVPKPLNDGVAGALSPFGCCELKPPKDVPGVDCVCCGVVCERGKFLNGFSLYGLPKLGKEAVVAVDGVTPFCCGCVFWFFVWPKPPKDGALLVLFRFEKRLEVDDGLKPFCCGVELALLLPPKELPKLFALLPPNALPPLWPPNWTGGGGGVPLCCVNGLFWAVLLMKLKPPSDPGPPD